MKGSFQLADWEVEPQINALRRAEHSVHVEPKVMQVLVELASHSNEVLSKDQLIRSVWTDSFVSDDVLTRCISEIRRVLDDDPKAPKFIQTIPKTGYRLIAPVVYDTDSHTARVYPSPVIGPDPPATVPRKHISAKWWLLGLAALFAAGYLSYRLFSHHPRDAADASYRTIPFTSYPGTQAQPSFSPDGNQMAFVWDGDKGDNQDIYVKVLGTETPLRLTNDPADEYSPTWSPDGRFIAFLRYSEHERGIYILPSLGGPARKVFSPVGSAEGESNALSWSPDGKYLVFSDGKSAGSPGAIYALDLASESVRAITHPPKTWDGDASPALSPDGDKLAFVRGIEGWVRDLYVMDYPAGEPHRLTSDDRMITSLTWTADSKAVVFSSNRAGKSSLWKIDVKGGEPERLPVGTEDATDPALSHQGINLAYVQGSSSWEILRVNLRQPATPPITLLSSTEQDSAPKLSPDGRRIAFQSLRSGTQEIWLADADGHNPARLTSFEKGITGSPSWAPDSKQLAFDSRPEGHSHIYTTAVDGGPPRRLTDGDFNDILPNWSHDGKFIYFGSNRSGSWQIWKVAVQGGSPQPVTAHGGFLAQQSPDGKWLYFAKSDAAGLWRIPEGGGAEQKVLDQPPVDYWGYWSVTTDGIFYLNQDRENVSINQASLEGEHQRKLRVFQKALPPFAGLSVSPDLQSIVYNDRKELASHITLVEGLHY